MGSPTQNFHGSQQLSKAFKAGALGTCSPPAVTKVTHSSENQPWAISFFFFFFFCISFLRKDLINFAQEPRPHDPPASASH
jgi:hypothetical protein